MLAAAAARRRVLGLCARGAARRRRRARGRRSRGGGPPGGVPAPRPLPGAAAAAASGRLSGAAGRRAVRAARRRRSSERRASARPGRVAARDRLVARRGPAGRGGQRPRAVAASASGGGAAGSSAASRISRPGAKASSPTMTRSPRSSTLVRLRLAAARSLEAAAGTLGRACGGLPSRAGWGTWADAVGGVAEALFEAPAAAAVRDAAGRLAALDVLDEEVDVAEMTAALRAAACRRPRAAGQGGPRGRRRPHAARDPRSALPHGGVRRPGRRRLSLARPAGPPSRRRGPSRLAEALGARLPLAESRDAESTLLFAFACEAARERLTLLAPRTDAATGRPRAAVAAAAAPGLAVGGPSGRSRRVPERRAAGRGVASRPRRAGVCRGASASAAGPPWLDAREFDTAALLALSAPGAGPAAQEYLGAVLGEPDAA